MKTYQNCIGGNEMNLVSFNDVTVSFEKIPVLHDINLNLEDGKVYSLIGPNGAGKSTLMETVMGFHSYSGDILLNNQTLKGLKPNEIKISYVPQENNVYRRLSVCDNIQLARTMRKSDFKTEEIFKIFPILEERKDQAAYTLSGGEMRQLAIALAIVNLNKFIMLDEPLTGLSPKMVHQTLEFVKELIKKYDITVLISEQNLEVADISDYIYVMRSGEIVSKHNQKEWNQLTKAEITEMVFGRTS
jgi:branched-chain amino acid transport system ATP-binding protein